jgi:hypothetical protein
LSLKKLNKIPLDKKENYPKGQRTRSVKDDLKQNKYNTKLGFERHGM